MKAKLSNDLMKRIRTYYTNRSMAPKIHWNKQADLDKISEIALKDGWSFSAIAGTFWFKRSHQGNILTIEVSEKNVAYGGKKILRTKDVGIEGLHQIFRAMR